MHTMVNYILFMALLLLLLLILPSSIMVNARGLTTKNAIFSVDLIPRNSSKINLHGGGRGKFSLGSISYHHKITLSSKFYDLMTVQSAVIPDGGAYDMKISIGTPPVEFSGLADTGSDLIWVQCSPCHSCTGDQSLLFDPTQSSTYSIISCNSQHVCDANQLFLIQTRCSTNDNSCIYLAGYGGGVSVGVLSTDTITFPTSIPNVKFGCGYDQYNNKGYVLLGPKANGIVGLGGGPLSLVSQLGSNINYKFSYCLTPASLGVTSKLNFGLDVTSPGVVSIPFAQGGDTQPTFYSVTLDSISIGNSSVPVANIIVVDSGTTFTYLPSNMYGGIKTAIKASIALNPVNDPNQNLDPCYETGSLDDLNFPGMVFHFSGGDVMLKAENSFYTEGDLTCFAMLASDDTYIFGNIAQTNFHVGFDLQAKHVSFAPVDCTQN